MYVEGGGDGRFISSACREGFGTFFAKFVPAGRQPRVIASGSRNSAFDAFKTRVAQRLSGEQVLLLVDSESPVRAGKGPWAHVANTDSWAKPTGTSDDDLHLMVQCTESWLIADLAALSRYYGAQFRPNALPANPDIEKVAKKDVMNGLRAATVGTQKGEYHKTRHGFDLLAMLDPTEVRRRSAHAERLCVALSAP